MSFDNAMPYGRYRFSVAIALFAAFVMAKVHALTSTPQFVGFDLGTSGARISLIEKSKGAYDEIYSQAISWDGTYDDQVAWMDAVQTLLQDASKEMGGYDSLQNVASICVSGTSASCLLVDGTNFGKVTRKPRMYNYDVINSASSEDPIYAVRALELLNRHAPERHTARAKTGSLAKLLTWNEEKPLTKGEVLCHQADYIAMKLMSNDKQCGAGLAEQKRTITSDWHNCLKLGYDVRNKQWPSWLVACLEDAGISDPIGSGVVPPIVVSPGEPIGTISKDVAKRFNLPDTAVVVGGTTDSNAAFFAAVGGTTPAIGTAVTSLGSTLAIKQLSQTFVEDATRGVYSHRFPTFSQGNDEAWLVGGASNVGCAVLRQEHFSNEELAELSKNIDPSKDCHLEYYPLTTKGERFPEADSEKQPVLEPIPESRKEYLHGILQGISDVERDGFLTLGTLGASPAHPHTVWTCGGGSRNDLWTSMRQRRLSASFGVAEQEVRVEKATNTEASFGAAILAAASFN